MTIQALCTSSSRIWVAMWIVMGDALSCVRHLRYLWFPSKVACPKCILHQGYVSVLTVKSYTATWDARCIRALYTVALFWCCWNDACRLRAMHKLVHRKSVHSWMSPACELRTNRQVYWYRDLMRVCWYWMQELLPWYLLWFRTEIVESMTHLYMGWNAALITRQLCERRSTS